MCDDYFQVIWVEHVEVDDKPLNNIYMALVNSGIAFGAKRWLATLERYCERQLCAMELIPTQDVGGKFMQSHFVICTKFRVHFILARIMHV